MEIGRLNFSTCQIEGLRIGNALFLTLSGSSCWYKHQKMKISVKCGTWSCRLASAWPEVVSGAWYCKWRGERVTVYPKPETKAVFGKYKIKKYRHGNKLLLYSHKAKIDLSLSSSLKSTYFKLHGRLKVICRNSCMNIFSFFFIWFILMSV